MTEPHALGDESLEPKESSASGRNLIGKNLGKYYIAERLSQGGTAAVYKAYQAGLSRYVAVKVMHSHLTADESFVERFEHEAIAVASLRHPNIVQVFDFDLAVDLYYMVMEFIEGPTLEARLVELNQQEERLPLAAVVDIINALASAIDYAHSRGMIHRDLKPSNVMFTGEDNIVLTDFGIAHIVEAPRYTATGDLTGTPAYMSPEQAQGQRVDERTDIYSLGVILYEMVTGRLPFEGDTPFTLLMKHVNEPVPLPTQLNPQLAPAVEAVVLRAMAKDSNARYQTAAELAQALQIAVSTSAATETMVSIESATVPASQTETIPKRSGSMAEHLIGQQLAERYQVLNLLGSGGMGTVFKGYDETLQREVAIKVMHPHVAAHPPNCDQSRLNRNLGAMTYQMLTGQVPFGEDNPAALVFAHLQEPAPDPRLLIPTLPDKVATAIMHAMAKEPAERQPTAGSLVEALSK